MLQWKFLNILPSPYNNNSIKLFYNSTKIDLQIISTQKLCLSFYWRVRSFIQIVCYRLLCLLLKSDHHLIALQSFDQRSEREWSLVRPVGLWYVTLRAFSFFFCSFCSFGQLVGFFVCFENDAKLRVSGFCFCFFFVCYGRSCSFVPFFFS